LQVARRRRSAIKTLNRENKNGCDRKNFFRRENEPAKGRRLRPKNFFRRENEPAKGRRLQPKNFSTRKRTGEGEAVATEKFFDAKTETTNEKKRKKRGAKSKKNNRDER